MVREGEVRQSETDIGVHMRVCNREGVFFCRFLTGAVIFTGAFCVNFSRCCVNTFSAAAPTETETDRRSSAVCAAGWVHPIWAILNGKGSHHVYVLREEFEHLHDVEWQFSISSLLKDVFQGSCLNTAPRLSLAKQSLPPFRADKYSWYNKVLSKMNMTLRFRYFSVNTLNCFTI